MGCDVYAQAVDCRGVFRFHFAMPNACLLPQTTEFKKCHLLCHEQDIYCAQVKLVVERECGQAIEGRVYSSVQHDGLSLVLDDVTASSDLVTPTEREEHQLVRRIDGLLLDWRVHGGM